MCFNIHPMICALIMMSTVSFYLVMQTRKKSMIWVILTVWLSLSGIVKADMWSMSLFGHYLQFFQLYHGLVAFSWQLLRLTSFTLDYCAAQKMESNRRFSLSNFLGYSFYMPVFMEGLPFNYAHYANMIQHNKWEMRMARIKQLSVELIHLFIIHLINDLMLHYFYTEAVIYDVTVSYIFISKDKKQNLQKQSFLTVSLSVCIDSIRRHYMDGHCLDSLFVLSFILQMLTC